MPEQEAAYNEVTGRSIPSIPNFLAQFIITTNRHTRGLLVYSSDSPPIIDLSNLLALYYPRITSIELRHEKRTSGEHSEYEAQVALAKKAYPMRTFKAWVEER